MLKSGPKTMQRGSLNTNSIPNTNIHSTANADSCYKEPINVGSSSQANLEEDLWSQLPEELIERILAWLPVARTVRLRSVCRKWKSFLQSDRYYRNQYQIDFKKPWLFLCTAEEVSCAFDFELSKWHRIPNPAIPRASILSAAGNILCLGNLVADCRTLSICNPVRKTTKELPPTCRVQLIHKVSITLARDGLSYKIMVAGEDASMGDISNTPREYKLLTDLYDSKAGIWRRAGNPLGHAKFGSDPGVWWKGVYYCITELPYGVVVFDPRNGSNGIWTELSAAMPSYISTPCLVEMKGRVLMVGRIATCAHTIRIWQLNEANNCMYSWVEFGEVPQCMCTQFMVPFKSRYFPLVCCGVGDWLCIATYLSPRVLAFNLCSKTWAWLPTDPLFPQNRNSRLLAVCFEPRSDCQL